MTGAFVLQILRNDLLSVAVKDGKITLGPRSQITQRHRELVRKNKTALIAELAKWPTNAAPVRNPWSEPPRPDERGHGSGGLRGQQPKVTWRRR